MNTIKFKAVDKYGAEIQPKPVPASTMVPTWYKNMPQYISSNSPTDAGKLIVEDRSSNAGPKKCVPMLDGIISGYIYTLFADVQIIQGPTGPRISWRTKQNVFEMHGVGAALIPAPPGFASIPFKYLNTWIPETPKGYSIMVSQPAGHVTPFHAIPAIIDSDRSTFQFLPPLWVSSTFEGIVEKGTPLAQVTPFKRENWASEFDVYPDGQYQIKEEKGFNSTIVNHYIKNSWSKKSYR